MPADEGMVGIGDGLQFYLTIDRGNGDSRLSHDKLVSNSVVSLAQLSDTPVPLGSIRVGYLNSGVDSTRSTVGPLSALYNSWSQLFKFPVADLAPNITDSRR